MWKSIFKTVQNKMQFVYLKHDYMVSSGLCSLRGKVTFCIHVIHKTQPLTENTRVWNQTTNAILINTDWQIDFSSWERNRQRKIERGAERDRQSDCVLNSPNYQLFVWWWRLLRKVSVIRIPSTRAGVLLIECMQPD